MLSIAILVLYYIFLSFPYPSHRKIEIKGGIILLKIRDNEESKNTFKRDLER